MNNNPVPEKFYGVSMRQQNVTPLDDVIEVSNYVAALEHGMSRMRGGFPLCTRLIREVHEETGLTVLVGAPCLINEFHDPASGFHQVDLFFRCTIASGTLSEEWRDPERVVTRRRFFSRADLDLGRIRFKPDSLPTAAWGGELAYDPLEVIVR